MNTRSYCIAILKALIVEAPMTDEIPTTVLKRRDEQQGVGKDEKEIASRNRADALNQRIAAFESEYRS